MWEAPLLQRQRRLQPLRTSVDLDVGHPLDPLKTAFSSRGKPDGIPVSPGKESVTHVCGEKVVAGLGDGEPAIVAGGGGDLHAARLRQQLRLVQQAGERHARHTCSEYHPPVQSMVAVISSFEVKSE